MPDTFIKIASVSVGSGGASSIDFTSIPSTYTDLVIKLSGRMTNATAGGTYIAFNGNAANYSSRGLEGNGSSVGSFTNSGGTSKIYLGVINWGNSTASTFSSFDVYLPNYAGSQNKSVSVDQVTENNATDSWATLMAGLWSDTSAISSLSLTTQFGSFVQHSTATLYGIKNS